jgi:hypothetical protein
VIAGSVYCFNNTIIHYISNSPAFHVVNRSGLNLSLKVLDLRNNHVIGYGAFLTDANVSLVQTTTTFSNLLQSVSDFTAQGYTLTNLYAPASANSPTVNAGVSEAAYSTSDILGVSRPQGGAWDIGAYEYPIKNSAGATQTFQVMDAVVTAPMVSTNDGTATYLYQPVQTTIVSASGLATFTFTVADPGSFVIQTVVNAPSDGENSFYVGIDALPKDPAMIWDIPSTAGFEQRFVSWRGNGTDTTNQFIPKVFNVLPGMHQLVFAGREANVQLRIVAIVKVPDPPANLHFPVGR